MRTGNPERAIYRAKISPPRLHSVIPRERLFRLLDNGSPVTWISSPAGSGKTTLVAGYARDRGLPVAWYHVDETDTNEATLFYYPDEQQRLRPYRKTIEKERFVKTAIRTMKPGESWTVPSS